MSRELPYFRWYPADAESDFAYSCFSSTELGVFHRALNAAWTNDGLPNDEAAIGRALRLTVRDMKEAWPKVREMFYVGDDGKLRNKRQEEERTHATTKSERNTKAVRTRYERTSNESGSPAEIRARRLDSARNIARHTKEQWSELLRECGSSCVKCGDSAREILKDHITPIYKGGSDGIENLQPLCSKCNASKGPDCTDYRPEPLRSKYVRNTNEVQHARARAESPSVSGFESESVKKKNSSLPISSEEFDSAWERHKFYQGNRGLDADKQLVAQTIAGMNGEFDPRKFRERHPKYCAFHEHTRRPWAEFGVLSMLSWIRAGMPLPPKTKLEQELEDIENAYPEEDGGNSAHAV